MMKINITRDRDGKFWMTSEDGRVTEFTKDLRDFIGNNTELELIWQK